MFDTPFRGTTIAFKQNALMFIGASGVGKSSLALQMMAMGCRLVSDDYTVLQKSGDKLIANAPPSIKGKIEARGIGILSAETVEDATIVGMVDLELTETQRLPVQRHKVINGVSVRLFHKVEAGHFPAALLQYLKSYCDTQERT